jgi:CheY-like chemotaxis protein
VSRARHGLEALEQVDSSRPDVILLDLMMPVMDGVAFSQALRQRPRVSDIPIVVISADGNPQRAAAVGAAGYLAKPFDIDALLAQVAGITRAGGDPPRPGV